MKEVTHRTDQPGNSYKGIPIHAAKGLHEACFELVKGRIPPGSYCLDIAGGSGAFSQRLLDAGYRVQANDVDASSWMAAGVPIWNLDLNAPIPETYSCNKFDMVIAIEVIEHLESPLKLLRDCIRLCKPGGHVLVTTPNTVDRRSYMRYALKGYFDEFCPKGYRSKGHITILPSWLLQEHARAVGLANIEISTAGLVKLTTGQGLAWYAFRLIQVCSGGHITSANGNGHCTVLLAQSPGGQRV